MLAKPVLTDGSFAPRQLQIGDVMAGADVIPATIATAANLPITGLMLLGKYILRNPAAVSNENIDSAANLLAAFNAAAPSSRIQDGTSFICRWISTTANALTLTAVANTGIIINRGVVAGNTAKEFLITLRNGTPARTYSCTTTNASAIVGMTVEQAATLTPGMIVLNAVAGLQGLTIIGVNIQNATVTMSANANATTIAPGAAIQFSPVVVFDGLAG